MAMAFGVSVLDGQYTKAFTVTCLAGDSGDLAVDLTANGMTNFVAYNNYAAVPIEYEIVDTTAALAAAATWSIHTVSATTGDCTIRKSNAAGSTSCLVILRRVHSIDR